MKPTAVSVIIPVHNGEAFLLEALESALTQDLCDIEVICVDDGSTDRSAFIIEQLMQDDDRLKLVQQEQSGASAARNRGIDEAQGEFIAFLDADDWYEESSYLRTLYEGAKRFKVPAAAGCFVNWWSTKEQERSFVGNELLDGYEFVNEQVINWRDWQFDFGFHRFIFARTLFANGANRFQDLSFFEDPVFLVRILNDAESFFATPNAHYIYRLNHKTRRWNTAGVLDFIEGARMNLDFSRTNDLALLHKYTVDHFDDYVGVIGLGMNKDVDGSALEDSLQTLEATVNNELLAKAGYASLPYRTQLSIMLHPKSLNDRLQSSYHHLRYIKNRILPVFF